MSAFDPFSVLAAKIYGAVAAAALIGCAVQTVRIDGIGPIGGLKDRVAGLVKDVSTATARRDAETRAHEATKTTYRAAQQEAAALERERLALVKAQQKDTSNAIAEAHRRDLAALRARAERLRREIEAGAGPAGSGRTSAVPGVSAAAGRAAAEAGNPRLPRPAGDQLTRDLIATEQALQLEALIAWVQAQAAIDPNQAPVP